MIGNRYEKLEDKVYQINLDTGIYDFGNITGQANQLWRVSVTGNQLINLHDNMPLMVDSNVGWVFDQMGEDFIMMNPVVVRAVDCRYTGEHEGEACKTWDRNDATSQKFFKLYPSL